MKTTAISFFILCIALFTNSGSKAQSATKEEAVQKVFKAFQKKDVEAFVKLFPDAATTTRFVQDLLAGDSVDEEEKAGMREFLKQVTDEKLRTEYSDDFNHEIAKGERMGIDWKKTTLQSFTTDSSYDAQTNTQKVSGKIYFISGAKEYFMQYDHVILFKNEGWYGVNIERLNERSKENEPEDEYADYSDSTTVAVDSVSKSDQKIPEPKKDPARTNENNKKTKQNLNTPIKKED